MDEQFIGNYKVVKLIGRGGMGRVYLAVHKDVPNLRVILKILSDPRLGDRFKQEADKLALLDGHPNICKIKHFFHADDDLVIAMEYIDGVTLDDKLKEGRMPVAEAVRIVSDMLAILQYAHERGISHRDIKPSNVMIDKAGQVKIIDFGIAKGKTDPNLTMTGASLGTPSYMAPEQFVPADDTDYALTDIYACGTTLYKMLTGKLPFTGENEFILRDAKLAGDAPRPRSINSSISKELEGIVMRAIDRDPKKRYPSAEEMRKALQSVHRDESVRGQQPTQQIATGPPPPPPPSSVPRRKSRTPLYIGAAIVLVAVVAGLLWLTGGPPETANVPPSPRLIAPPGGTEFTDGDSIQVVWQAAAGERGTYLVEHGTDSTLASPSKFQWSDTSFTFPPGRGPGVYYWQVTPTTDEGITGPVSERRSFVVTGETPPETAAATGTIVVTVIPSGDVFIDDQLIGRNRDQASLEVEAGEHSVRVEKAGSRERVYKETVDVEAGGEVRRSFRFSVPPQEPAVAEVEIRVGSTPRGALIYVDGELQPVKTNNTVWVKPGRHEIRVVLETASGEQQRADTVTAAADSVHKVLFDFEE